MASRGSAAVIIPTHNRVELLSKVLDSVLAQTVRTEIYVMDDASTDDTQAMVARDYPHVSYHREGTSRGPTFQRNKGAALAQAEILFMIDDDCVLRSPRTFAQTLEAFDHPRVAAVTLPFINVRQDALVRTAAPNHDGIFAAYVYFGGMVALRRGVFLGAGGYRNFLFMHMEEPDLAIRLLDAGYIVRLGWADPLEHRESPLRDRPLLDRQGPRNNLLFSYYNVPWPNFPFYLTATTALCFWHGLRVGHPIRVLQGLAQGFAAIVHEFGRRAPVSRAVYRLARALKRRRCIPLQEMESHLPPIRCYDNSPSSDRQCVV
ncbi:MAG: glycosyltransferase family A protein [Tepidisphaeraceae bacterium]|jgi:glycosyltransferase involved in cell wall biosynthesis